MTREDINHTALQATLHCLLGCSIGEVLGMVLTTALGWGNTANIVVSIALAFIFGYALSMLPLLRHGLPVRRAMRVALAADTASIATMELADNAFMLAVPGAIDAGLNSVLFWVSLATSLVVAFAAAFPVNRWLIARGKGHAALHQYHHHDDEAHEAGTNKHSHTINIDKA